MQPIDDGVLRMIGSAQAEKLFSEKTFIIEHQRVEIDELRECLSAIKNNKEARCIEEEQARIN